MCWEVGHRILGASCSTSGARHRAYRIGCGNDTECELKPSVPDSGFSRSHTAPHSSRDASTHHLPLLGSALDLRCHFWHHLFCSPAALYSRFQLSYFTSTHSPNTVQYGLSHGQWGREEPNTDVPVSATHISMRVLLHTVLNGKLSDHTPSIFAGNRCCYNRKAIMSTIMHIVCSLEGEIRRIYELDVFDFRQYIGAITPDNLVLLWESVAHYGLRRRLFEEIDPQIVSMALKRLPYNSKADSLKYMPNEQRRLIAEAWSLRERHTELVSLDEWQHVEDSNWPDEIADIRIMTGGQLPEHYPPGMDQCASCGNPYRIWESITILDCRRHSYCEACNTHEGACRDCDTR